jgi:hypothetical protein
MLLQMPLLSLTSAMFMLSYYVAAVNPAVADVLVAVGSLHGVPVLTCAMLFLTHHVAAGIPAVADLLNAVGSLHEVPVFACDHAVSDTMQLSCEVLVFVGSLHEVPVFALVTMLFLMHQVVAGIPAIALSVK